MMSGDVVLKEKEKIKMVDFSKKSSKKRRAVAVAICAVLVLGFVIGMLVSAL